MMAEAGPRRPPTLAPCAPSLRLNLLFSRGSSGGPGVTRKAGTPPGQLVIRERQSHQLLQTAVPAKPN